MPPSFTSPGTAPRPGERAILCARCLPLEEGRVEKVLAIAPDLLGSVVTLLDDDETLRMALFRHGPGEAQPMLELAVIASPEASPARGEALGATLEQVLQATFWSIGQSITSEPLSQEAGKGLVQRVRLKPDTLPERIVPGPQPVNVEAAGASAASSRGAVTSAEVASDAARFSWLPAQLLLAVGHLANLPGRVVIRLEMGQRRLNAADLRGIDERLRQTRAHLEEVGMLHLLEDKDASVGFLQRLKQAGKGYWLACEVLTEQPLSPVAADHLCLGIHGARHAEDGTAPEDFLCPPGWYEKRLLLPAVALAMLWAEHAERPRPCEDGVVIGNTLRGLPVYLHARDRARHTYVIGANGTGKSTLLANMALQDMEDGRGVILFDPHGDLWQDLRRRVPASRRDDLMLCHLGDQRWPFTCNLLEGVGGDPRIERNMIVNNLIQLFKTVLYRGVPEAFGPMFEYYFRTAMMLLMIGGRHHVTLKDFERVFNDRPFQKWLIEHCDDEQVLSAWEGIIKRTTYSEISLENVAPYIVAKLTQITGNPLLEPVLAARESTLDFGQIIRSGGICLINLASGTVGEKDAAFAGGVLSIRLAMAARAGARLPASERGTCYVYMDEFQEYATQSLAQMVSGLRKFGVHLTLANQTLAQLEAGLDHADLVHHILGNVANVLAFRVGQKDAILMESWFPPEQTGVRLTGLPDYHIMARVLDHGVAQPPRLLRTLPPPPPPSPEDGVDDPPLPPQPEGGASDEAANDDPPPPPPWERRRKRGSNGNGTEHDEDNERLSIFDEIFMRRLPWDDDDN